MVAPDALRSRSEMANGLKTPKTVEQWYHDINTYDGIVPKEALKVYADKLIRQNLPVIFEFSHLADCFGLGLHIVADMIHRTSGFYRSIEIPKRRGGYREISIPSPPLLHAQRWINEFILNNVPVSEYAHGFIVKRNIITNATPHLGAERLLKMDITDFFGSIQIERVIAMFNRLGYTPKTSYFLSRICCYNGKLPQGAATSPGISNIITKRMDKRLGRLANSLDLNYTRYADDLTFSGTILEFPVSRYVSSILYTEGFTPNARKTILVKGKGRKIVTGISIASNKLTLPKETRRIIRQQAHYMVTYGSLDPRILSEADDPMFIERLIGKIQFWNQVEPQNNSVLKLLSELKILRKDMEKKLFEIVYSPPNDMED